MGTTTLVNCQCILSCLDRPQKARHVVLVAVLIGRLSKNAWVFWLGLADRLAVTLNRRNLPISTVAAGAITCVLFLAAQ